MKWTCKSKKLWYLLDETPVKLENGLPVSAAAMAEDSDTFCALVIATVHEDNIEIMQGNKTPKTMWTALKNTHHHTSAGSRFFYLRSLMTVSAEEEDDIPALILEIKSLGTKLTKLCKDGKITIEDIQVASLTTLLPESFTSVTSPFEQEETVKFEDVCKAVRNRIVTRKNRSANIEASTNSSANVAKSAQNDKRPKGKGKKRDGPSDNNRQSGSDQPRQNGCTHCGGKKHTVNVCLKKKNDDLNA